jgi:hypothetical protein
MADQDSKSASFWTSLPGILTGISAVLGAIATLAALFLHSKPAPTPAPAPAPIVSPATTPVYPEGSRQWCDQKVADWSAEMAKWDGRCRAPRCLSAGRMRQEVWSSLREG